MPSRTRIITTPEMLDPSPPKPPRKNDTRIPIERLIDDLKYGKSNHRSKGWRRKEKLLYKGANHPSFKGPMPAMMTPDEQHELYAEVVILEQHIHFNPGLLWRNSKKDRKSGKFVRSREAVSIEYGKGIETQRWQSISCPWCLALNVSSKITRL